MKLLYILLISALSPLTVPLHDDSSSVPANRRVDCHPSPGATEEICHRYNCIWDASTPKDIGSPPCYLSPTVGYLADGTGTSAKAITLVAQPGLTTPYGDPLSPLHFTTTEYGKAINIRITTTEPRYEPPIPLPRHNVQSTESLTVHPIGSSLFSFAIERESTGVALWNTSIGGFLFADQYIQIATYLPTAKIYGFGDNEHFTLMHNLSAYKTWPMFARDQLIPGPDDPILNLYGVQPFYMCLEDDAKAHGVLIYNSNAQEVTLGPAPHLIYRTIGGILDITFFPGPRPEDVIQQYTTHIGKPFLPAYFALGFQLCRYGYKDLQEMEDTVAKVQAAKIPLDIPYADIEYMHFREDFTIGEKWKNFSEYSTKLHKDGLHLFLVFDPAIQIDSTAFINAKKKKAGFFEWPTMADVPKEIGYKEYNLPDAYKYVNGTKIIIGAVWPDWYVAIPDFLNSTTIDWWVDEFKTLYKEIVFDGIWIDMNEPSVFGTNEKYPWYFDDKSRSFNVVPLYCPQNNKWDNAPYKTHSVFNYANVRDDYTKSQDSYLCSKTLCMNAVSSNGKYLFYDTHDLYGITETIASDYALRNMTGKRGAVITRSTFVSSGHYAGHWLGDNTSGWSWLQTSIIGMMEFNMFGIPYVGSDICGFIGNTTEELCLRWSQLGAFYPFCRNHNVHNGIPQSPAEWPSVAHAARQALLFRYHYLPYLYSLMFNASLNGGTVVRPLFFEFPNDKETYQLNYQFMWGSALMVIPVVNESDRSVWGYVPTNATWYSLRDSDYGQATKRGWVQFSAPLDDMIPVFVRAGYILPRQKPETTTTASRKNSFELLIAVGYDGKGIPEKSIGEFYWDDGESLVGDDLEKYNFYQWQLEFTATATNATITIVRKHNAIGLVIPSLDIIDIIGYSYCADLSKATINGSPLKVEAGSVEQQGSGRLFINATNLINLTKDAQILVNWPHQFCLSTTASSSSKAVESTPKSAVYWKYDVHLVASLTFVLLMLLR